MYNGAWIVIGGLVFLLGISDLWLESIFEKICLLISTGVAFTLVPRSLRDRSYYYDSGLDD
jgi:hypothetical protein